MVERSFIWADFSQCTSCRICEYACALEKEGILDPLMSRVRVTWIHPMISMVVACRFCEDAPCVAACTRDALVQSEENGVILVNEERCDGCGWCIEACPYGAVMLHPERKVAMVCDLCGGDPQCIDFCPEEALKLVTEDEIKNTSRLAMKNISVNAKRLTEFVKSGMMADIFVDAEKKAERLSKKLKMLRKKELETPLTSSREGRSLKKDVENLLKKNRIKYEAGRKFMSKKAMWAKADFSIPSRFHPRAVIEVKDHEATGSKDLLGDILKIIQVKDSDTRFYLVTDEIGWFSMISDLKHIIELQNKGDINMIYTRRNLSRLEDEVVGLVRGR